MSKYYVYDGPPKIPKYMQKMSLEEIEKLVAELTQKEIERLNRINNKKNIKVVAALIEKNGKYLIARRAYGNDEVVGRWEFPGGKVEPGEDENVAIEREIREEFDLEVKSVRYLTNNVYEYPTLTIDLRLYECKYISGEFKLHDHYEYKYVNKEDILNYELCPADVNLAEYVKNEM